MSFQKEWKKIKRENTAVLQKNKTPQTINPPLLQAIKDNNENVQMESKKVIDRQKEYFEQLLNEEFPYSPIPEWKD